MKDLFVPKVSGRQDRSETPASNCHSGEKSTRSLRRDRYPPGNLGKIEGSGIARSLWNFYHLVRRSGQGQGV